MLINYFRVQIENKYNVKNCEFYTILVFIFSYVRKLFFYMQNVAYFINSVQYKQDKLSNHTKSDHICNANNANCL